MHKHELDTLIQRVHRLEHTVLWWRGGTIAALSLIVALLLMGQAPRSAKSIVAEDFLLRDSSGVIRARLGLVEGSPSLALLDNTKHARLSLLLDANGSPSLIMADSARNVRMLLSAKSNGPSLILGDSNNRDRLHLSVFKDQPTIMLKDTNGELRLGLSAAEDQASLSFFSKEGLLRASIEADPQGTPSINLLNRTQQVIWKAP